LQRQDFEAWEVDFDCGKAEEFGSAFARSSPNAFSIAFCGRKFKAKAISSLRETVMHLQVRTPSTSPDSIRLFRSRGSMPRISAASTSE